MTDITPNPHIQQLAQEFALNPKHVQGAVELIDQGNTIPFIARYRKEATGSMDDQVLRRPGRAPGLPARTGYPQGGGSPAASRSRTP